MTNRDQTAHAFLAAALAVRSIPQALGGNT